jgi:uncharacterized protein (DUF1501 family)
MANIHHHVGRRDFLKRASAATALAGTPFAANLLALGAASAQPVSGYKALVCIFLNGGNDQSNTVVPMTGSAFDAYARARQSVALPASQLISLSPQGYNGPALGLNASLSSLKPLFDQGKVALLSNVGTLVTPITLAQWNAGTARVPAQLFSHSDQQGAWQTGIPDRVSASGWLGRIGDLTAGAFNPGSHVSIAISTAGNNVMQTGNSTIQYQITTAGAVRINAVYGPDRWSYVAAPLRRLMTEPRTNVLEAELTKVAGRAIGTESEVSTALASVSPLASFPDTSLGRQLQIVARMIGARNALSQKRQIFFVEARGYDTHDGLIPDHNNVLKQLGDAMAAFYQATVTLGVAQDVTAFTASDFGRGLQGNGRGSDHGWGGHHFIMGGGVLGNRVYGSFPTVALKGPEDVGQGRLMPTTSVDEYAATLARWFGVADTDLTTVLPNLGRFPTRNLGFLG